MNVNFKPNSQSPKFGMAVKIHDSALPIIKKQTLKLTPSEYAEYFTELSKIIKRQEENPVNIIIQQSGNRNALEAIVVDNSDNPLDNAVFSQSRIFPSKFGYLERAEFRANRINDLNEELAKMPKATDDDFFNKAQINGLDIDA